ncbi:hypothetical protein J4E93_006495 [Alternaria ventricosa]|uniref:uncharacterized protein n=1 Tax=Alternaria ventricosa TaxID=1187951 RepID=UPI0020C2810D|nr:uncharacterized protein J4E93_006495 [Alternaria ventricosa]KAI4643485.1 hypothetical protein J4E93_006495 [Alternaria ventricosa]
MAPDGFLPNAPYKTYIGLMLSCPQIYNEMTSEAVRLAPSILRTIQFSVNATPMKLQPLRPTSFASLMHLTIGIPRWAMLDRPTIMGILQAMAPVLELHLARLTIGLEDLEGEDDVLHMVETLNPAQIARYMSQLMLENPSLEKERWMVHWRDDKGKLSWSLKGKPGLYVWLKLKEKRESRLKRAVKSLFRQT